MLISIRRGGAGFLKGSKSDNIILKRSGLDPASLVLSQKVMMV